MDTTLPGTPYSPTGAHREDPYSFYAMARATEPVFFSPQLQMWCVTRHADVTAILADPESFSSRNAIPDYAELGPEVQAALRGYRQPKALLNMDRPEHTTLRRMVMQVFSPRRIATMEPAVREVTAAVVDEFAADGHADMAVQLAYPLPLTVIFRLLGVPAEDMSLLQQWTGDMKQLIFAGSRLPTARQVQLARNMVAYQQYIEDLATERDAARGEDIVSYLIQATDEDGNARLSLFEVADMTHTLVIAGHETFANAFGNILHQLLAEPSRWRAICADPGLIEAAVEEGLRADSGVNGVIRTATRPVTVCGTRLPAGARLFLLLGSANTDERCYPDPGQFQLDRSGQPAHLAFGRGIHHCVGAPLARLEAKIALEVLTERFPGMRLATGAHLQHIPVPLFRGFTSLPVVWDT
jgi:cytochrome P450